MERRHLIVDCDKLEMAPDLARGLGRVCQTERSGIAFLRRNQKFASVTVTLTNHLG
jgi:hypothetical protein